MREVTVKSTPDSGESKKRRKLPYTPASKVLPEYSDAQKKFSETYNEMRQRLLDIGEMNQK